MVVGVDSGASSEDSEADESSSEGEEEQAQAEGQVCHRPLVSYGCRRIH